MCFANPPGNLLVFWKTSERSSGTLNRMLRLKAATVTAQDGAAALPPGAVTDNAKV